MTRMPTGMRARRVKRGPRGLARHWGDSQKCWGEYLCAVKALKNDSTSGTTGTALEKGRPNKRSTLKKLKAMKNVLAIAAFAGTALFASCRSYDPNDADVVRNDGAAQTAQEATIDSLKLELAKQRIVDSMNEVARLDKESTVVASSSARTTSAPRARTRTRRASSSNYSGNSYAANTYSQPTSQPVYTQPVYSQPAPAPAQKRGWSAKAKGAVIGAGTGAISGAVINKRDRVKGGIIGGVLGAGVGTGIGAILDRKNGR